MSRSLPAAALIVVGLLALSLAPAMATSEPEASPSIVDIQIGPVPLEGTVWQLTNARLSGAYAPIPAEVTATLILNDGNAGGEGGCNRWFAPYTLAGGSLTFGIVGSTLMLCDGAGGTIETFYLADLPAVATWAIDGTTLTLSADDGQPVLAYTVQPTPSLVGGWVVSEYRDSAGDMATTPDATTVVAFDATSLNGTAGCNSFRGTWSETDGVVAIGPLMSTKMACTPAELMTREADVISALEASTTLRGGRDGSVYMLDAPGLLQVTLIPA